MEEEKQQQMQSMSTNKYYTTASALQIRLDTEPILHKIESFLRGGYYTFVEEPDEKGDIKIVQKFIRQGIPKANEEGIQSIINFLTSIFNAQVVQGNFDDEMFDMYICEMNKDLASTIITNSDVWEIEDDNLNYIIDSIMYPVYSFISRTLYNKEREGYSDTLRSNESTVISSAGQRGFFGNKIM